MFLFLLYIPRSGNVGSKSAYILIGSQAAFPQIQAIHMSTRNGQESSLTSVLATSSGLCSFESWKWMEIMSSTY